MAVGGKWIFKGGKWVFERIKSKFKKPVKVEVKKLPQGATVSERSKKYMGQSVQDAYKKTIASSRTKSDVKDIFKTKEWQEFAKNLAEKNMDKVMPVCKKHCKIRDSKNRLRKENYIYKGVNKEIQNEKRGTTQILSSTAQMEEERELRTFLGEPDEKKTNS